MEKLVQVANCKLVVSLNGIRSESFIKAHNRVIEKFVTDNYNMIIAKNEIQRKKKYIEFNTFEKEEVYKEGKEYADYLIDRFYVQS